MKVNKKKEVESVYTHGGAVASRVNVKEQLTRMVMACLLWEDQFYVDGVKIADKIRELVHANEPDFVAELAIRARKDMNLRHVPLLLIRELARSEKAAKHPNLVKNALAKVVQRADELAEFVSIYWKDGKQSLSAQVKKGLAEAFGKFDEYQFSKYKGEGNDLSLRDVMFLVHPKPANDARAILYNKIANQELKTPDTWEVNLSAGKDKKETFLRLMKENKLGALAFIRNLRNMYESGITKDEIKAYAEKAKLDRVLPFRFITASKHVPAWEDVVEKMMLRCLEGSAKIPGKTVLVIDISGSMQTSLSSKSDANRLETAYALAILAKEVCEEVAIYATAGCDYKRIHATDIVPSSRRGFALAAHIRGMNAKLGGGGIFLTQVMDYIYNIEKSADQVIILTDEQDCDIKLKPDKANAFGKKNYIINLASYQNGIAYSKFTHINGWSEAVLDYIRADIEMSKLSNQVLQSV